MAESEEALTEDSSGSPELQNQYRTRVEQCEGCLLREIIPWLTLSGLLEGETKSDRYFPQDRGAAFKIRDDNASLQLGLIVDLFGLAEAETVIEYDSEPDKFFSEEAFITFDYEPMELSLGKQFTPLGLYISHFVTGPMLEFGETSARRVASLIYGPGDDFDLTFTAYRGRISGVGEGKEWDWAAGFEARLWDGLSFGLSYQSDLADADERLLEDSYHLKRVAVASGYLQGITDAFEFSLEAVAALDDFRELEKGLNRPVAWNAEVVYYFPKADIDMAFRIEQSRELEDEPEHRYGVALTWYPDKRINLTVEYLRARFAADSFAIDRDEDDICIRYINTISTKLSIAF
jgi:hypothetical protein